jgi:serine/threonine protein kinase/tetratricopeptide (TPR) repeat protein
MLPGSLFAARFEIERLAGKGGMGEVYRARDRSTGELVALKLLHLRDDANPERLLREAEVLSELRHPGIVRHVGHGIADGRLYLAMEWLEGETLSALLRRGPLAIAAVVTIGRRVAGALHAAHLFGLVHRDIKPSNLLVTGGDPAGTKLLDFGIVRRRRIQDERLTATGALLGTPGYMAPEQARGAAQIDGRADLFSLGCVLFQALTGRRAFEGDDVLGLLVKLVIEEVPRASTLRAQVPPPLDDLVARLLSKDPDGRPREAAELLGALLALEEAPPPPPSRGPVSGAFLGAFRLLRALDRGETAPIWLAEELRDGRSVREVAVELVPWSASASSEGPASADDLLEQARALCRVEHPAIARVHAVEHDAARGLLGLVMEHVPGENLQARVARLGPIDELRVIEIGIRMAWALAAVHQAGLLHRDLRPSRIVQGASGYTLVGFGLPTIIGAGAATDYAAPELATEAASAASDLYALGATLLGLRTGAAPAPRAELATLAITAGSAVDAPELLVPLSALLARLLDPDPHARPQHAEWVARELGALLEQHRPSSERVSGDLRDPARGDGLLRATAAGEPRDGTETLLRIGDAPLPFRAHPPLEGRAEALAAIAAAAHEARAGALRFVLISGPLGIGRSRLLEAAIEQTGLPPCRVLRAVCSPERRSPLRPLLRAIDAHPAPLDALREAALRAVGERALPGREEASEALEGVEGALLDESADAPLALVMDDLQWADAPTLALLAMLVERAASGARGRLLVLVAARDEPGAPAPLRALLGEIRARLRPGLKQIALAALSADEAARVAQGVSALGPDLTRAVALGSGGVPFFVVHALMAFHETGGLVWRSGAWHAVGEHVLRDQVPGVVDLLAARLASYFAPGSPAERAALRAIAAIALYGGGLGVEVILRVGGDEAPLEAALEALVEASILTVSGDAQEYGFAQEMTRQAALTLVRQRPWFHRLHRSLLDVLAEGPSAAVDARFLGTGYEKLGAGEQARRWLQRALHEAIGAGLSGEAAEIGDRLTALTEDRGERVEIDLAIVRAALLGRRYEDAKLRLVRLDQRLGPAGAGRRDLLRRIHRLSAARGLEEPVSDEGTLLVDADALGDPALRAEARAALAGVSRGDRALELASEAVALASQAEPAVELACRVLRVELNYGSNRRDLQQARGDLERALTIAHASSSIWLPLHIEGDLAVIEADLGQLDAAVERLLRLVQQAEALKMRGQLRVLLQSLAAFLLRQEKAAEAALAAGRVAELARESGDPTLQGTACSLRAEALRRAGQLESALASADQAEGLQRERHAPTLALTLLRRAEIFAALGRSEPALADARAARAVADRHDEQDLSLSAALWEALHLAKRGEVDEVALEDALTRAASAGGAPRALRRTLIQQAEAFLATRRARSG